MQATTRRLWRCWESNWICKCHATNYRQNAYNCLSGSSTHHEEGKAICKCLGRILDGALKLQIAFSKSLPPGFNYYTKLNPDFLFAIAELYLQGLSMKEMNEGGENPSPTGPVGKGIKLLESITKQIPGFLPAYLMLTKGKLAVGSEAEASSAITNVL